MYEIINQIRISSIFIKAKAVLAQLIYGLPHTEPHVQAFFLIYYDFS